MAFLELKLLGGLSLERDGAPVPEVKSQKGQALLCYLAVSQKLATRSFLAALFWPDIPESQALMNLRKVLQRLQPLKPYLIITRETVAFDHEADSWLDVAEFERAGVPHDISRLQKAITLYQGDFLDGFILDDAPLFDEWVLAQRARLREMALAALQRLVAHFREEGAYATAVAYARQHLTIEPWQEEAHRELMRLLALSGQRSVALVQYETCRQILAEELGVEPAAATVQLVEQIKTEALGTGAEQQESKGDGLPPHNLPPQMTPFVGREAELARLGQLLAGPDVHLITILGAGGMGKTRLALALAERQLSSYRGASKTHPYQHGVYFASLARLETADLLLPAIAEAVNFRFAEGDNQREQLLRYLANKAMLLVLDNFEHLLAGTGLVDEILRAAPQVKIVITSRTRLNRQVEQLFPVEGMAYPPVNGATSADRPLDLNHYSAVQLFVQCARRVRPDFELAAANQLHVLEICHLLQGMPLGIVLAASWLESLSIRAISREIRQDVDFLATDMGDVPRRQRSLRAAFNHSWRLLSEREQVVFCQMSIFRGGFTRAAAQAVTGATLHDLQGLVNKSLLTLKVDGRYDVHELLRQFAAEKLSEVVELETATSSFGGAQDGSVQAVRERHSAYYCTFLQQHTDNWHTARQLEALAEVTGEADNVQSAWRWALQQEAWLHLSEAIDSWSWYHQRRGLHSDGEAFCQAVCASLEHWATIKPADAAAGYRLWAKSMAWYGEFAMAIQVAAQRLQHSLDLLACPQLAGEDTRPIEAFTFLRLGLRLSNFNRQKARSCLEESLLLYEAMQDAWGIGTALRGLADLDWSIGDYALAQQRAEASLAIHQKRRDQEEQAHSLSMLGWIYQHLGHLAEAERFRHKVLDLCQQLGNRSHLAPDMVGLSYTLAFQGRFDEGRAWGQKSLRLCLEDGYLEPEGFVRLAIGFSHLHMGQYVQAQKELTRSLALVRETNSRGVEASVHGWLGYLALVNLDYEAAQAAFAEGYRLYQATQGDAYTFSALSGLGFSTCCRGDLGQARHYFRQLLTEGLRRKDFLYLLFALPGLALYLARRDEVERAITVWAQAQCQPFVANSKWYEDVVGLELTAVAASLPRDVAEVARRRGQGMDLWQTAEALLAELASGETSHQLASHMPMGQGSQNGDDGQHGRLLQRHPNHT